MWGVCVMGSIIQKTTNEIAGVLADIKAGDILGLYAALWMALALGAIIILAQINIWEIGRAHV